MDEDQTYQSLPLGEPNPVIPVVPNTHGPEQGNPPLVVFPSPHQFVSYFEGRDGDQWRFLQAEDNSIDVRCGRFGWGVKLTPYLVPMMTMKHVLGTKPAAVRSAVGGTCAVVTRVGDQTLGDSVLVLVDDRGLLVECDAAERLWVHACMLMTKKGDQLLSPKQLEGFVKAKAKAILAASGIHAPLGDRGPEGPAPHVHGPHCRH